MNNWKMLVAVFLSARGSEKRPAGNNVIESNGFGTLNLVSFWSFRKQDHNFDLHGDCIVYVCNLPVRRRRRKERSMWCFSHFFHASVRSLKEKKHFKRFYLILTWKSCFIEQRHFRLPALHGLLKSHLLHGTQPKTIYASHSLINHYLKLWQ